MRCCVDRFLKSLGVLIPFALLVTFASIIPSAFSQEEKAAEKAAVQKARQEAAAKEQASPKPDEPKKAEDEKHDEESKEVMLGSADDEKMGLDYDAVEACNAERQRTERQHQLEQ